MRIILLLAMTIGLTNFSTVFAATGEQLFDSCKFAIRVDETGSSMAPGERKDPEVLGDRSVRVGYCIGFITGMVGTANMYNEFSEGRKMFCVPKNATWKQTAKIIIKYLEDNPAELHSSDVFVTTVALKKAFPCRK